MNESRDPTLHRYLSDDYEKKNPDWDIADAAWKANKVVKLLADNSITPSTIVEVGCGSGAVLVALRDYFPKATLTGYDIAPGASRFWVNASRSEIQFKLADYLLLKEPIPDLILLLDVLEHIGNPWEFLARISECSKLILIHFPLDLSVISVFREHPLLHVRDKVGHLHYFTRGLALSLLNESGFEIIDSRYTGASLNSPARPITSKVISIFRRLAYSINRDKGALLFGGETLLVLARPRRVE